MRTQAGSEVASKPAVPRAVWHLPLLAAASGGCALAYEVLYLRLLTTLLGDLFYVHAALLSTFLVGIGMGAVWAHRWWRHLPLCEALSGVYALLLPLLVRWLSAQSFLATVTSSPLLTVLMTILLLVLPGVLVGVSLPLFSAYLKAHRGLERSFQGVYAAYNLGALAGILGMEFALFRWLGLSGALAAAGAVNLASGLLLWVLQSAPARLVQAPPCRMPRSTRVALVLASLASAVFQMFFFKLMYLVFEPHRENFALGLSIVMLGIWAGAELARRTRIRFEHCLLALPVVLGLLFLLYQPLLRAYLATREGALAYYGIMLLHRFFFGSVFALGPLILFGAALPALLREEGEVARESGLLLCLSSLANAAGYLLYVFLGHPLLSTSALLTLVGLASLSAAWLQGGATLARRHLAWTALGCALLLALCLRWEERALYFAQWLGTLGPESEVVVFKRGPESVSLMRQPSFEWITYNGHPSINVQREGIVTQPEMISGIIPALTAPSLERALVLGLGTGITAGAAARIFKSTDVVEINEAFWALLPRIAYANLDLNSNPGAHLHLADGRAFLIGKEGRYDAIINSIPAPSYFSAAKIYTREFYERVVRALKPEGVFCTWLAVPNMSETGVLTILSSLRQHFRFCDLRVLNHQYYMASCSNQPLRPRKFSTLPVQLRLLRPLQMGLAGFDLDEFFEDHRISADLFAHGAPQVAEENTDDRPVLEFLLATTFHQTAQTEDLFLRDRARWNIDALRLSDQPDMARTMNRAGFFYRFERYFFSTVWKPYLDADPYRQQHWNRWVKHYEALRQAQAKAGALGH